MNEKKKQQERNRGGDGDEKQVNTWLLLRDE